MSGAERTTRAAGRQPASPPPIDERTLLTELWQISHFGWITEPAIRRGVIISGGRDVSPAVIEDGLRRLVERGWVEQRSSVADAEESEWRLTATGRGAVSRG